MTDRTPGRGATGRTKVRLSAAPMLIRALRDGVIFAVAVAVIGGIVGWLVAGAPGLFGGLLGAALAAVFLGLTAVSILVGGRAAGGDLTSPVFFGVVLGTWVIKILLFVVLAFWLRAQSWLDGTVFFVVVIIAVIGSLVLDLLAFIRTRVPYVSDVTLPGEEDRSADDGSDTKGS
jgi:hypothetical protein